MSGRLCQWAHWEGWVSGWSRGKQPSKCTVNNQSIRDYYTDSTEISPPSRNPESVPFWGNIALIARIRQTPCFFNFLKKIVPACLCVCVCVCRLRRPGCFAAPRRLHSIALVVRMKRGFLWNYTFRLILVQGSFICVRGPGFTQRRRSGEPIIRRSLGWVHWIRVQSGIPIYWHFQPYLAIR